MKKTAVFLLIIFSLVQALPVIDPSFGETMNELFADEQKADENSGTEEKKKDDYSIPPFLFANRRATTDMEYSFSESIQSSPFTEKRTPPPDRY